MGPGGTWYNELQSQMILNVSPTGELTGTYDSQVGHAPGPQPLVGKIDMTAVDNSQVLGWVVRWNNPAKPLDAVTVWCGQYQIINGEEVITTQWLLTEATDVADDWESTLIGHDLFTRNKATDKAVQMRSKSAPRPYPKI
jgi:hypothetical protein